MITHSEAESATRSVWKLNPAHTLVEFSGKHMMFTTVKGHFTRVRGTIVLVEDDPARSSVEVEIDTSSLYSGEERRDNYLKSADFLDSKNHPLITFKSTRVELRGSDRAKVVGNLTIRGVMREVVLDTEFTGRGKNLLRQEIVCFDARTSINRKDFGLTWTLALENSGFLAGDIIKIELTVEGIKQSS